MDQQLNIILRTLFCSFMLTFSSCNRNVANSLDKFKTITKPIVFEEGIISTNNNHEGLSYISSNRNYIIFTRSSSNFENSALYGSRFKNGKWMYPEKLDISPGNYQAGLAFSPNNKKAYFTNKMTLNDSLFTDEWNIWEIEVANNYKFKKESTKPIAGTINSNSNDCCLTMNSNGKVLFSSKRDGTWDIYQADYANNEFINIKKVHWPISSNNSDEWPSYINNEGTLLMFSSIRKTGIGGDDIYYSIKKDGEWQKPTLMDTIINSKTYEDSSKLTKEGFLFFSSWKNTNYSKGFSNIYIHKLRLE